VPFIIPLELPLCIIPSGSADPGAVSGKKHEFCFTKTSKERSNVKISDNNKRNLSANERRAETGKWQ
jgi:hypothetical protein